MALIKTVSVEEATGDIRDIYDGMIKMARAVPKPLQMVSASPKLLSIMFQSLTYFIENPSFSNELLTHIRLLVADKHNYAYCVMFNESIMQMLTDISDEQLAQLKADPSTASLDPKEKGLLLFVLKAVEHPDQITQEDVSALRDLGWIDREIVEATNYGADMVRHGILFKSFKMDED